MLGRDRCLDAIDRLREENRAEPRPEREAELVRMRNRGFGELGSGGSDYAEPAEIEPGTAPEDDGLPAVQAAALTASIIRGALLSHGCLLVRGLVDPEDAGRLAAGVDRAFEGRDAGAAGATPDQTAPWYQPFEPESEYAAALALGRGFVSEGSGLWTADSPRMLFDLLETFERAGLRQTVSDYLGERPAISVNKGTLRRATPTVGTEWWHQDGAFLGEGIRSLNIWLSLTDSGVDAPGLEVVPRRLEGIVETGSAGADFEWSVGDPVVEEVSGGRLARPVFQAGDAMLFDHLFLHRTGSDPSMTKTRYAVETWFFAPSAYPDRQQQVPLVF